MRLILAFLLVPTVVPAQTTDISGTWVAKAQGQQLLAGRGASQPLIKLSS